MLSAQQVECYKDDRQKTVMASTINRELAVLKRMFSLCETQWQTPTGQPFLENNRIRRVSLLKEGKKRERWLEQEQLNKLLLQCDKEHGGSYNLWLMVLIASETGLRHHGVVSLRKDELYWRENVIKKTVKGSKEVTIPLTDRLREALLSHLSTIYPGPYIFPSINPQSGRKEYNSHIGVNSEMGFKAACTRAGIDNLHFHDLRHTFATLFYGKTKDWKALQMILGHSDIKLTMNTYAHLMANTMQESFTKFQEGR
jgi:integrase